MEFEKHVLIIGSGPNAVNAAELEIAFDAIVVINNAWRVRSDWSHLIYPYDCLLYTSPSPRDPT